MLVQLGSSARGTIKSLKSVINHLTLKRFCSNAGEFEAKRASILFSLEKKNQYEQIGRIEKIEVNVTGPPEEVTLLMNQNISTPYDCAKHISESVAEQAALALVNSEQVVDMHAPLTESCSLKFLYFRDQNPQKVNLAFWRTCSIILGAVIKDSFKETIPVMLHSFPAPNVKSGSFVYDVSLGLNDWVPKQDELRIMSGAMVTLAYKGHPLERLTVEKELALEIFEGNKFKQQQIPNIAKRNGDNKVTLYRVGDHVDVSRGPLIGNTSLIGRCTVTAVHKVETQSGDFYRFQGVALPKEIRVNHFAYSVIEDRARKFNSLPMIVEQQESQYQEGAIA